MPRRETIVTDDGNDAFNVIAVARPELLTDFARGQVVEQQGRRAAELFQSGFSVFSYMHHGTSIID